ncbi:hypothetical protein ACFL09_04560 [Planctomycetota bacterium]
MDRLLDKLRSLLDRSMELLRDRPESVDPEDYRFPAERFAADLDAACMELRECTPGGKLDKAQRLRVEEDLRRRTDYRLAGEREQFRADILSSFWWRRNEPPPEKREGAPSLRDVLDWIERSMEACRLRIDAAVRVDEPWGERASLAPQGKTLTEQYNDYRGTRWLLLRHGQKMLRSMEMPEPYDEIPCEFEAGHIPDPVPIRRGGVTAPPSSADSHPVDDHKEPAGIDLCRAADPVQLPDASTRPLPTSPSKLPDCPCGKGKWEHKLSQKELAHKLRVTPGYLRLKDVVMKLAASGARQGARGEYAECAACGVGFYRAEFGLGARKGVKREQSK